MKEWLTLADFDEMLGKIAQAPTIMSMPPSRAN